MAPPHSKFTQTDLTVHTDLSIMYSILGDGPSKSSPEPIHSIHKFCLAHRQFVGIFVDSGERSLVRVPAQ